MNEMLAPERSSRWLVPSTLAGRWSAALLAGSAACFVAFFLLVMSGQRGGDTFFSNPWLSGAILVAAGLAIAAGIVGLVAAVRHGERSVPVGVAIVSGLLVVLFVIGEVTFPH